MVLLRIPFYILFIVTVWSLGVMFGSIVSDVSITLPNSEYVNIFVSSFKVFGTIMYCVFVFVLPIIICSWFEAYEKFNDVCEWFSVRLFIVKEYINKKKGMV